MKRLIAFGDSWTAGHGIESDVKYKEDPFPNMFTQKLRDMNSWPRWVAEKLDRLYVNLGVCGYGNEYILKDIMAVKNDGLFNQDDIIIVMLSYPYRYKTKDIHDVTEIYHMIEKELEGYTHFYFNSFYPSFREEDFDTSKLPKYFINPNGCVADVLKLQEEEYDISVWEYGSRRVWNDEKNYWEGDYHPNIYGYKLIGDYIYNKISTFINV
jgi:hypothetical protein